MFVQAVQTVINKSKLCKISTNSVEKCAKIYLEMHSNNFR